jgi:aspartate aminotransferase-like enzyme
MHIRKQRLLTAGPTPLLPSALHAMMGSDIHHRTDDFRKVYRQVLTDLQDVMGTSHDVLALTCSGTGAMEASVTNFFSFGDSVVICCAGKFGERWVELAKTFGLSATVLEAPYGGAVSSERLRQALSANTRGVFVQASESSTGAAHDMRAMGELVQKTGAILITDAITGLGTMPLDIHAWGLDIVIGGSQKAFMVPPGLAFLSISPKAWTHAATATLPRYYFDLKKEKKNAANGESSWTPAVPVLLALAEALKYIKSVGMNHLIENAQLLAKATRAAVSALGLELFAPDSPGAALTAIKAPPGMDSGVIVKDFRRRFGSIVNNGQGSMKGQIIRLAHLGYFDFPDLFAVIAELEIILAANDFPVQFGTGTAAVQQVYVEASLTKEVTHA